MAARGAPRGLAVTWGSEQPVNAAGPRACCLAGKYWANKLLLVQSQPRTQRPEGDTAPRSP
jgi:hypothetical protein